MLFLFLTTQNLEIQQGKPFQIKWDFTAENLTLDRVTRFEVAIDSGSFFNAGLPLVGGTFTYQMPTGLILLNHRARVRACNEMGCSTEASILFTIVPAPAVIGSPTNLRLVILPPPGT